MIVFWDVESQMGGERPDVLSFQPDLLLAQISF